MSSKLSVLFVDDNLDGADSFFELLRDGGYEAKVVYTSLDALASVAENIPDVFIADIGLPQLDGCELATRVKAMTAEMPLMIAVTGYPNLREVANSQGSITSF